MWPCWGSVLLGLGLMVSKAHAMPSVSVLVSGSDQDLSSCSNVICAHMFLVMMITYNISETLSQPHPDCPAVRLLVTSEGY